MSNVSMLHLRESREAKTRPLKLKRTKQQKLMGSSYRKGCMC